MQPSRSLDTLHGGGLPIFLGLQIYEFEYVDLKSLWSLCRMAELNGLALFAMEHLQASNAVIYNASPLCFKVLLQFFQEAFCNFFLKIDFLFDCRDSTPLLLTRWPTYFLISNLNADKGGTSYITLNPNDSTDEKEVIFCLRFENSEESIAYFEECLRERCV